MNIVEKPIGSIKPYARNAKKHEPEQVKAVANSIREFGFVQPIVVDKEGTIVIGHCRYQAAKSLGLEKVPCVCVDELTQEQIAALRLADNKLNESLWDYSELAAEIADIPDYDFTEFGFSDFEMVMFKNAGDDWQESEETQLPKNEDTTKRIIIIMKNEAEVEAVKQRLGVKDELKATYTAESLMEEAI